MATVQMCIRDRFHAERQAVRLRVLRETALEAMRFLASFRPKLVGPVLHLSLIHISSIRTMPGRLACSFWMTFRRSTSRFLVFCSSCNSSAAFLSRAISPRR